MKTWRDRKEGDCECEPERQRTTGPQGQMTKGTDRQTLGPIHRIHTEETQREACIHLAR